MKTTMLVLAVLMTGCSGAVQYDTLCDTRLVKKLGGEFKPEGCNRTWRNLDLAKGYLMEQFLQADGTKGKAVIGSEEEWQRYFSGVTIWASDESDEQKVTSEDPGERQGSYDPFKEEIQLHSNQASLMHMLLHRMETIQLDAGTLNHDGWDKYADVRGFYGASFESL